MLIQDRFVLKRPLTQNRTHSSGLVDPVRYKIVGGSGKAQRVGDLSIVKAPFAIHPRAAQWLQNTTSFKDSFGSFKPIAGPAFLISDQMPAHAPFRIFLVAKFNIAGGLRRQLGDIAAVMCFPAFAVGDNHHPSSWHSYKMFFRTSG